MNTFRRLLQIGFSLWGYLLWWALVRLRLLHPRQSPAERLARLLERLGTTFVKLGQAVGLRRDLLPEAYVKALESLQDRVAPFPGEAAVREITQALGAPPDQVFAAFDPQPLASASIAQVHAARLHDGTEVIVKVRRPGIRRQVAQDLRLLRLAVRTMQILVPVLRRYRLLELLDEAAQSLREEMDFRQEARSIQRFREAFADWETINVPAVFEDLSTDSVLVQEHSAGRRVDDPALRDDGPRLARNFLEAYMHQFFVLGLFHGDPHPGNLFIMADGRICFHDFGLVGFLDRDTRRNLAAFMSAFVQQDADWLLDAYRDLGVLTPALDERRYRAGLEKLLADYARLPLKDWSFAEAFVRLVRLGQGRDVRLPRNLLIFMRTLFLMETTVRSLDPDFNLVDGLADQVEKVAKLATREQMGRGRERLGFEAGVTLQDLPNLLGKGLHKLRRDGVEIRLNHHGLTDLERHLDRASNRLALALVTLGLYIASALLMQMDSPWRLWSMPVSAIVGFALALWFTLRLALGIARSGRL